MPNDNDGPDEESADLEDELVCIDRCQFGRLIGLTAEMVEHEIAGEYAILARDDLRWLENIAMELLIERQFARYDDDTN
jgi:hypothetical protein